MRFPIVSPMPIFIHSSGGGHLTGPSAVAVVIIFGFIFWALLFLIVLTITDKYKYSELSFFGKVLFFPFGLIPFLVKKVF